MIKVGVLGAAGRMGVEVCRAVEHDPDLDLVAVVDPIVAGQSLKEVALLDRDLMLGPGVVTLSEGGARVGVDFTIAEAARSNIKDCIAAGINVVVGTTGLTDDDFKEIELRAEDAGVGVFIAPNFTLGAVLMMKFAAMAAKVLPAAEIIELHHSGKKDAPSGTAVRTRSEILAARGTPTGDVPIHSVRLPGLVAHQEVLFGSDGETLSIRHDSIDRRSYMPGVLLAIKRVSDRPGLTIGLDKLLDL